MQYPGFIGPSYQSRSPYADAEQCANLYPESIESGNGKSKYALYPTPGLLQTGSDGSGGHTVIPGCIMAMKTVWNATSGFMESYAVITDMKVNSASRTISIYNTLNNGLIATATIPGTGNPPQAAFIACNGKQFLVGLKMSEAYQSSALYLWDMTAGVPALTAVSSWDTTLPITGLDFLDGFFTITTTSALYASAYGDGGTWNALSYVNESDEADGIIGHVVDHRLIWIMGKSRIEAYYNAGGVDFPFQRVPQGVMELGCMCAATVVPCAESLFWVGITKGGGPVVYRSNGYSPVRVSTHAIEQILQKYLTQSDTIVKGGTSGYAGFTGTQWAYCAARAFTYTENGHTFYVLNFGGNNPTLLAAYGQTPSSDPTTTLVYDVTEGLWHERQYSPDGGTTFTRHLANFYLFDQLEGKNIVSDYRSAILYYQGLNYYDDNGQPLWRWRIAPHLATENKWNFYSKFTFDFGLGPAMPTSPYTVYLQWSDDAGKTWSTQQQQVTTDSSARIIWRRLGKSRNRIYKVSTSAAGDLVWLNAFLELQPGNA